MLELFVALFLFFTKKVWSESVLCSKCNYHTDVEGSQFCATSPPSASHCAMTSGSQYCSTVKEYDSHGALLGVIRDCSPDAQEGCKEFETSDPNHPAKICYQKCQVDGCNSAPSFTRWSMPHTILFTSFIYAIFCVGHWWIGPSILWESSRWLISAGFMGISFF